MSNRQMADSLIYSYSGQRRVITVPVLYVELLGDYNSALVLNQIIFWSDITKRKDGYFYKTYDEWNEEILLTEYQVRRAVKKLKDLGLIETKVKKANGSPTVHYKIVMENLTSSILKKLKNGNLRNLSIETEETSVSITDDYTDDYYNKDTRKNECVGNVGSDDVDKEKKEVIDFDYVLTLYSKHCSKLPQIRKLTSSRKTTLKNWGDVEEMEEVFKLVSESNFLQGLDNQGNQTGKWVATFDWIIKPSNRVKILEGNYKNKGGKCETVTGYDFTDEII